MWWRHTFELIKSICSLHASGSCTVSKLLVSDFCMASVVVIYVHQKLKLEDSKEVNNTGGVTRIVRASDEYFRSGALT